MKRKTKEYIWRIRLVSGATLALFRLTADFTKWALPIFLCSIFCLIFLHSASAFSFHTYSSSDGKVRLIVPLDAVTAPAPKPISKQSLSASLPVAGIAIRRLHQVSFSVSSFPKNSKFLIAADFKPDKAIFKKDAVLIFTLPQAEIPGTPIQLYYYNTKTKKFIPEGSPCAVAKDGYTIMFKIRHFSSYAAFAGLNPISTPIGTAVKIPLPDLLTGSFSHSIPLTIPPGRKGMQPGIALSYRSSNPNSWTGVGWSMNPGFIVRATRLGPPSYNDTQDTFYFISDAGTTELVHLIDNLYQAKVESSFTKFFKETNDSWRILNKDGSQAFFGQTSDSKETSSQGTFSWYITRAQDTNGNYVEYTYTKDQGKIYLYRINYTGHTSGIPPAASIEFITETRTDISSSYLSTARIATARRLKTIEARLNSDLVWRYELEYEYSQDTNRSLLKNITQYASDNASFPSQTFTYQKAKD